MTPTFQAKSYANVMRRVFDIPGRGMTRILAENLLALDFPEDDADRIEVLNRKANDGNLTPDEVSELETFANVADLLAYWQSKARQLLNSTA